MQNDQRTSARKILKVKAKLMIDGVPPVAVRTVDIASNGMSVAVEEPCRTGLMCTIAFDLLLDGKPTPINARSKIAYCILSGGQFKVGLTFQNLDMGASSAISKFLR